MPRGKTAFHLTINVGAVGEEADRSTGIEYTVAPDKAMREDMIVSAVRMVTNGEHAFLTVFNRGGKAGTLTVMHQDRHAVCARLLRIRSEDLPRPGIIQEVKVITK